MHMSTHIYVCIHIRWTCTYIFKCPFKYIIYKHIYIYNTHINPVCEETLGPLVLEYIYICYGKHTKCLLCLSTQTRSSHYIYICTYVYVYICMYIVLYTYIYIYVCMYVYICLHVYIKNIYTHIYACMYVYIYACMYTNTMDMHIYF